jgi:hypothetical protein|tara:strand:+ start:690 stop:1181 length:492 start_codon:yes stop_codon:yes gene_type:complete
MKDNFDLHEWNRNRIIESTLEDSDLKAKKRVEIFYNQIINDFPDYFSNSIDKSSLKFSISSAFTDLALQGLSEDSNTNQDDIDGSLNITRGGDDEAMGAEEEADNNVVGEADGEKEYEVEFWIYRNDDYDDDQVTVIAKSEEEALAKAKEENYKGKNFKILKR